MRRSGCLLFVGLAIGCGTNPATKPTTNPAANPAARRGDDFAAWQGTWKLVSCVSNGESESGDVEWVVSGDRYTIRIGGKLGGGPYQIKLDPGQKQVDVFHHDTPPGTYGGRLKGIYEIAGDSLKVCYDLKGQQFPTSFDAGRGSARVVYQFRRK